MIQSNKLNLRRKKKYHQEKCLVLRGNMQTKKKLSKLSNRPDQKPKSNDNRLSILQEEKDFVRWMSKDIAVLDYFAGVPERVPRELWATLEALRVRKGEELYTELLYALTHKFYPPVDAKKFWNTIVAHKCKLTDKIGREVGMKVAVLDYLDNDSNQAGELQLLPAEELDSLLLFANEDSLTGLFNHRYFQERLRYEMIRSQRYKHPISLLFIDLDHFKEFNDKYGHLKGDILLREVSSFFKQTCRQADAVARYGGDEFAFVLPEANSQQAGMAAERLQKAFRAKKFGVQLPGIAPKISISMGVATFTKKIGSAEELIAAADQALYKAKGRGRNCICWAGDMGKKR